MANNTDQDYLGVFTRLHEQLGQRSSVVNPWNDLFAQGQHTKAAEEIQTALSNDPGSLEAKLWWIEAEVHSGEVPLSALCSPLEEIVEKVAGDLRLSLFASSVCLGLASLLVERGQTRLAVLLLRRAFALAVASKQLNREEQMLLRDSFLKLVSDELEKAKIRQEKRAYLDDLQTEQKALRDFKPVVDVPEKNIEQSLKPIEEEVRPVVERRKPRHFGLSSKVILQQAADALKVHSPVTGSGDDRVFSLGDETVGASPPTQLPVAQRRPSPVERYGLVAFGIFFAIYGYRSFQDASEIIIPFPVQRSLDDNLVLPQLALQPVSFRTQGEKAMDSIKERLQNTVDRANSQNKEKQKEQKDDAQIDKEAMQMAADVTRSQEPPKNEIARIEKDEREILREYAPPLDPRRIGQLKVEDMGSTDQKISVDKLRVSPDGRRYGPSPGNVDSGAVDPRTRQPVEGYEVKQFDPAKVYIMLNDANVISAPSMVAVEVGRLRRGEKVEVVSSMGPWLELRSLKGKRGYVLAQDTQEQ